MDDRPVPSHDAARSLVGAGTAQGQPLEYLGGSGEIVARIGKRRCWQDATTPIAVMASRVDELPIEYFPTKIPD